MLHKEVEVRGENNMRDENRQQTFDEWMAEEGIDTYEEVIDWLESSPKCISVEALVGRSRDEYAMTVCQSVYNGN